MRFSFNLISPWKSNQYRTCKSKLPCPTKIGTEFVRSSMHPCVAEDNGWQDNDVPGSRASRKVLASTPDSRNGEKVVRRERQESSSMPVKILLVDEHRQTGDTLERTLRDAGFDQVVRADFETDLVQAVEHSDPDIVLLDIDKPNDATLDRVRRLQQHGPKPVILFSPEHNPQTIEEAIRSGVTSYVANDVEAAAVRPLINATMATFRKIDGLQRELEQSRNSLSDRKLTDRAKGILMSQRGLTEDAAYKMLQKTAMDRKRKIVDVAQDVIAMAEMFSDHE